MKTTCKAREKMTDFESPFYKIEDDMLIEKGRVGRLIGPGGGTLKALINRTGCEIFCMDKEGAPLARLRGVT